MPRLFLFIRSQRDGQRGRLGRMGGDEYRVENLRPGRAIRACPADVGFDTVIALHRSRRRDGDELTGFRVKGAVRAEQTFGVQRIANKGRRIFFR